MDENSIRYFTFPVWLLADAFRDISGCTRNIIRYSLYHYAVKYCQLEPGDEEAAYMALAQAGDYFGLNYSQEDGDWDMKKLAQWLRNGNTCYERTPERAPMTSISKDIVMDYHTNSDHKSEFQIVLFLAYAALKSIIQEKQYCRITNRYWYARMNGNRSAIKNKSELNPVLQRYFNEYQAKKIKRHLIPWGVTTYSFRMHGFMASTKNDMTVEALARYARQETEKDKQKFIAAEEKQAYIKAKAEAPKMTRPLKREATIKKDVFTNATGSCTN